MHRFPIALVTAPILGLALSLAPASAGVVMTAIDGRGDNAAGHEIKIYLEPTQVKIQNGNNGAIYHQGASVIVTYSDRDKSYMEVAPGAIASVRDRAMAMMKQQMANMSPEQRKQMEAMLVQSGLGSAAAKKPEIGFRKTASGQTVGSWRCDRFEELHDGQKVADLCIARLPDLGLTDRDLQAFKGLSQLVAGLGVPAAQVAAGGLDLDAIRSQIGYAGLPVQIIENAGGQTHDIVVKTIQRTDLPASTFQVPLDYVRHEMPMR